MEVLPVPRPALQIVAPPGHATGFARQLVSARGQAFVVNPALPSILKKP
jgi:hypothetical protein